MTKKPTEPENIPKADPIKTLLGKIDKNPAIRQALQEAMKKGNARRRTRH